MTFSKNKTLDSIKIILQLKNFQRIITIILVKILNKKEVS